VIGALVLLLGSVGQTAAETGERIDELVERVRAGTSTTKEEAELVKLVPNDEASLRDVLERVEGHGKRDLEAKLLLLHAYCLNTGGSQKEALKTFHEATRRAESPPVAIRAWISAIDAMAQAGQFEEVQNALVIAERIYESLDPPDRITALRWNHGNVRAWYGLGFIDRMPPYLEALEVLVEEERTLQAGTPWIGLLAIDRADWLYRCRRYEELIGDVDAALPAVLENTPVYVPFLHLRKGIALADLGRSDEARAELRRALENADADDATGLQCETRLADLLADADETRAAIGLLENARRRPASGTRDSPLSFEDHLHLVTVEHRLGRATSAELEEAFAQFCSTWTKFRPPPGGVPYLAAPRQLRFLFEVVHTRLAERGAGAALEALCRFECLGGLARGLHQAGASWPGLADARAVLTGETAGFLAYFLGPRQGLVFAVDARGIHTGTLPPLAILRDQQRALELRIRGGPGLAWKDEARALAGSLLPADLEPVIARWQHVDVLGLGDLGPVPFELLPFQGRRLEQHASIGHPLSLVVGTLLARRPRAEPSGTRELFLVAAPRGESVRHLPALPLDDARLRAFLGGVPEDRARTFVGKNAMLGALDDPELASFGLVHLVSHASSDWKRERPTTLALADGLLGCTEIEARRLPELVVYSACNAGRGPSRPGDDGVSDLGGAALRAGARTVILSPFPLGYDDAAELFPRIVAALRAGAGPAQAVREARCRWIEETGADPARGLYQVVGLGR